MRSLFLSHDGLTDPLGGSQILPYLRGLRARGWRPSVLSCEKPERAAAVPGLQRELSAAGIDWYPQRYHRHPPLLSSVYDMVAMYGRARRLQARQPFRLVHCRSYLTALVGAALHRHCQLPFLFDMRGFWADERRDSGAWPSASPFWRAIYRFFKAREREFLRVADAVVTLTERAQAQICAWEPALDPDKIAVIPCCCDLEHFDGERFPAEARARVRAELGIAPEAFVLGYLGSSGTWYMQAEMLEFFRALLMRRPEARFFWLTPDPPEPIRERARQLGIDADRLIFRSAGRARVPELFSVCQAAVSFIRPFFSKQASSPTKLGEMLALGIPVVSNAGIGDQDQLYADHRVGALLDEFSPDGYARALDELEECLHQDAQARRRAAELCFSLEEGVRRYDRIYRRLAPV